MDLPADVSGDVQAWLFHDEDTVLFINGVQALKVERWTNDYELFALEAADRAALKTGRNVIAVHCRQNSGGQFIDLGLVKVE